MAPFSKPKAMPPCVSRQKSTLKQEVNIHYEATWVVCVC